MGRMSVLGFLRDQWTIVPVIPGSLANRSILLTGANSGLGFEAAVHLAQRNPQKLILTCRDSATAEKTVEIVSKNGTIPNIRPAVLDLDSFQSVRDLVDKIEKDPDTKLDTVVANAAKGTGIFSLTKDGWESTLQVNYLSSVLLSILLIPHLIKSSTPDAPARLLYVTSDGHYFINRDTLPQGKHLLAGLNDKDYSTSVVMGKRYYVSKTILLMFTRELSARLAAKGSSPITVMSVNPGLCHSRLTREAERLSVRARWTIWFIKTLVARSTEMGSRTLVHGVVTSEDPAGLHGKYLSTTVPTEESDFVLSEEGQTLSKQLWDDTIEVLSKVDARVQSIVSQYLSN